MFINQKRLINQLELFEKPRILVVGATPIFHSFCWNIVYKPLQGKECGEVCGLPNNLIRCTTYGSFPTFMHIIMQDPWGGGYMLSFVYIINVKGYNGFN